MEFLKDHNEIINYEKIAIQNFIRETLNEQIKSFKNFERAFKNLKDNYHKEFYNKNLINKYSNHFGGIYNFFDNEVKSISDNCPDKIKVVIEDELFKHYNSLNFNKYDNHKYDIDFDNINYENVVIEILKYDVYFNISIKLNDLMSEIESFYKPNKIEKLDVFKLIEKREKTKSKNENQILKVEVDLNENKLNDKEQAFLFFILCKILSEGRNDKNEFIIPYTEIVRLQMLINLNDKNVFLGRYGDTLLYQSLTKEFNIFDIDEIDFFVKNLNEKLINLKLKKTVEKINTYSRIYLDNKKHKKT